MIETHKIVMAGNILWAGMAAPVSLVFATALIRQVRKGNCGLTERLMAGVLLVAFASMVHRFYWTLWRYFLDHNQAETAAWFVEHGWLLTALVLLIAVGYALHLKSYLESWLGWRWVVAVTVYAIGLCTIPFWI